MATHLLFLRFAGILCLFVLAIPRVVTAKDGSDEGGVSSGGGNAVLCFDDPELVAKMREADSISEVGLKHLKSIETYDLMEAKLKRGVGSQEYVPELVPMNPGESAYAFAERILNRLKYRVPALAELIESAKSQLNPKNIIYQPWGVKFVRDAQSIGLVDEQNCILATVANHRIKQGGIASLVIDERLFKSPLHSSYSRAALWLHEWIYMAARALGHTDSLGTRAIVSEVLLADSSSESDQRLADLAYAFGFLSKDKAVTFRSIHMRRIAHEIFAASQTYYKASFGKREALLRQLNPEIKRLCRFEWVTYSLNGLKAYLEDMARIHVVSLDDSQKIREALEEFITQDRIAALQELDQVILNSPSTAALATVLTPAEHQYFLELQQKIIRKRRMLALMDLDQLSLALSSSGQLQLIDAMSVESWGDRLIEAEGLE